jgi:3-hydroxy-3-methylglutaryl CoA synthase
MTNVGVTSYGVYIPWYRLSRKTVSTALGRLSAGALPGNKAVANYDEDSLTMAVAAGTDCLRKVQRGKVQGMLFATTTAPYIERESAAIIATALDLRADIRTADFTDSLKSSTGAVLFACDSIKAKGMANVLVCGSDCRMGKPGTAEEMVLGDGAAAILLGSDGVIASLEGAYSLAYDFPDYRRIQRDQFVRSTESRFIREEGYTKIIPEVISRLLGKYNLEAKDFAKVAYPCLSQREYAAIGKTLGFQPNQLQEPLLNEIGETGTASPLILLAAMLEEAKPGDNILIASYGNGADALFFKVTEDIVKVKDSGRLKKYIELQQPLASYEKYLIFRGVLPVELATPEDVPRTRPSLTWRERKVILALYGSKCKRCGTPQYPRQRVCVNPACGAIDEMEDYRFSDKKATLFSYTEDHASPTLNPPLIYGMLDFEGGGRFVFDLTDCESGSLKIGMPFEMTLRRKYLDESRGIVGYSWKGRPVRE